MVYAIIKHKVKDYDSWFPVFYEHGKERRRFGCIDERVYRTLEDPNVTVVILHWPSAEAFQDFVAGSNLQAAMKGGGVVEEPRIDVLSDAVFEQQLPPVASAAPTTRAAR